MEKLALVVDANYNVSETGVSLKELQAGVDGWIEAVDINENLTMWVNEEFLLRNEPNPNAIGTVFFATVGGTYDIQGNVVFTGGTDENGDTLGLSEENARMIRNLASAGANLRALA